MVLISEIENMVLSIVNDFIYDEYGGISPKYLRVNYIYHWGVENKRFPTNWSERTCKYMISKYMPQSLGYVFRNEHNRGRIYMRAD